MAQVLAHLVPHTLPLITLQPWGRSLDDILKLLINLRQKRNQSPEKYQQKYLNYPRVFKILGSCCDEGGNVIEEGSDAAMLYLLRKKPLRGRTGIANCLHAVVPEVQEWLQYKAQIPDEAQGQRFNNKLPGKTSLITADHSKLQKPTLIFNVYSQEKSVAQVA